MKRSLVKTVDITPIGKPRQTRSDRWKQRGCVMRYRAFCDELRLKVGAIPFDVGQVDWVAYLPIPASWSKKKKSEMAGKPHRQKPDRDNIDKAILDALFKDDSGVYAGHVKKLWDDGEGPRLRLTLLEVEG